MRAAHIAVLAQFVRLSTEAFQSQVEVIMAFLLRKVLAVPTAADPVRFIIVIILPSLSVRLPDLSLGCNGFG